MERHYAVGSFAAVWRALLNCCQELPLLWLHSATLRYATGRDEPLPLRVCAGYHTALVPPGHGDAAFEGWGLVYTHASAVFADEVYRV